MRRSTFGARVAADLDEAQFARHKAALVSDVLKPDKNLWERAEFYWQSIAIKQFDFDGRQALADAIEAFTLESWHDYYQRVFLEQPHSLQVVAPGRWGSVPSGFTARFEQAGALKQGHATYLVD